MKFETASRRLRGNTRTTAIAASGLILVSSMALSGMAIAQLAAPELAPPPFLLANSYHDQVDPDEYWVSEKLDGVRAWWDGRRLISRGGHVYNAPDWFTRRFPATPLDGELWMGRGSFEALSAAVRRHQPWAAEWRNIRFVLLDLPTASGNFEQRLELMTALVRDNDSPYLTRLPQGRVRDRRTLMEHLDQIVDAGGEGLVLSKAGMHYKVGRSDALLKLKKWQDAEAVVLEHLPGKGRLRGLMGSLLVETSDGRRFQLGTGFSDAQRRYPPPLGSTVTFRYQGLTDQGTPRFAAFQRTRQDF